MKSNPEVNHSESLQISVSHGHLEALYERPEGSLCGAALLCHPHPQHGGNMHTKALYHLTRSLNLEGFGTLRFNFRGVGTSTGNFDGGKGEKLDAKSALATLKEKQDVETLLVGGFSFGAAIGMKVGFDDEQTDGLVGIGVPVSLADFEYLNGMDRRILIVQGENDQFGSPEELERQIETDRDSVYLRVVEGAGHLFDGKYEELRKAIEDFFEEGPGQNLT